MIINLQGFIDQERRVWRELENLLDERDAQPSQLNLEEIRRFHSLYQRTAADLARVQTFAAERELSRYLEALVARAYAEIHRAAPDRARFSLLHWLTATFPQTFRRRVAAFWLALAITVAGVLFGGLAVVLDPAAKDIILPFDHLKMSPAVRVAAEEASAKPVNAGQQVTMTAFYMTHNTRVSILVAALGLTWGVGTAALLLQNGVILGAVFADFIAAGHARFVFGWLLPHGSIEIPAILVAGQAGLVLAGALIGRGRRMPMRQRLAAVAPDLVTLICGLALMLVWAGLIEAFLSQYHQPAIPYLTKIALGCAELTILILYLGFMGRKTQDGRRRS